jgi:hypothetical protein
MSWLDSIPSAHFAYGMLFFGIVFGIFWYIDHRTHLAIWKKDITDGELRTHRMILYASQGLMLSLLLMAWWPGQALFLFIGCWVTRTLHEFMDEIHWHLPRCSEKETLIHLVMWVCIHAGTAITFCWGFFRQYEGFELLALPVKIAFALIFVWYSWIGHHEVMDYKGARV